MSNTETRNLISRTADLRSRLINHPLYPQIETLPHIAAFAEYHVFAVWDFMSLLKALQRELTCVEVPWFPKGDADTRFLINEIVAGEESDVDESGRRASHFEIYRRAMKQIGANTAVIDAFLEKARGNREIRLTIRESVLPAAVKNFLDFTFEIIEANQPHTLAAVFTFGREDLIPGMFLSLVNDLEKRFPDKISILKYYLHRHIEVDGDEHSHLATQMTETLCGADETKWHDAETHVRRALELRIELWDAVLEAIRTPHELSARV